MHDIVIQEDANCMYYLKLFKVIFPMVIKKDWGPYLYDLVTLKPALVFGDAIGFAGKYLFTLTLTNPTPVCQRPIVYPRAKH